MHEQTFCLWKPHRDKGIRHKLLECRDCPKEEKAKLYDDLRKSKKAKTQVKRMKDSDSSSNITIKPYWASILLCPRSGNQLNQPVCTDIGAHVHLMDENLFEKIVNQEINFKFQNLSELAICEMTSEDVNGAPAQIKWDKISHWTRSYTSAMVHHLCYVMWAEMWRPNR